MSCCLPNIDPAVTAFASFGHTSHHCLCEWGGICMKWRLLVRKQSPTNILRLRQAILRNNGKVISSHTRAAGPSKKSRLHQTPRERHENSSISSINQRALFVLTKAIPNNITFVVNHLWTRVIKFVFTISSVWKRN